jgi:hypothetical protein
MFSSVLALSGRTLGAVEHHIVSTPFLTIRGKNGSLKDALSAFAMERVSIRVLYKKYELLGKSKRALLATVTLRVIQGIEGACSRHLQQAPVAMNEGADSSCARTRTR